MSNGKPEKEKSLKQQCTCPSWLGTSLGIPLRSYFQNPYKILKPYIKPGMTILDVGPGMGYFSIPLAILTGDTGKVIAADLQQAMLEGLRRNAVKAGVADRITLHLALPDKIGITGDIDFCLAFWMVHEVPDRKRFLEEIYTQLKPGGLFLLVEPKIHVSRSSFDATLEIVKGLGLKITAEPKISLSNAALLKK